MILNLLEDVEKGLSDYLLTTLSSLATALKIPLKTLFDDREVKTSNLIRFEKAPQRKKRQKKVVDGWNSVLFALLVAFLMWQIGSGSETDQTRNNRKQNLNNSQHLRDKTVN